MKKQHVLLLTIVAVIPGIIGAAAFGQNQTSSLFSNRVQDYVMKDANEVYNGSVRKALGLRAKGDLKGALTEFSKAAGKGDIFEYPNYKLWPDMAELYCKLGQKKAGLALLSEYRCAVDVLWDARQCAEGDNNGDIFIIPANFVTPLCYQICGDVQNGPTVFPVDAARVRRAHLLVSKIQSECLHP